MAGALPASPPATPRVSVRSQRSPNGDLVVKVGKKIALPCGTVIVQVTVAMKVTGPRALISFPAPETSVIKGGSAPRGGGHCRRVWKRLRMAWAGRARNAIIPPFLDRPCTPTDRADRFPPSHTSGTPCLTHRADYDIPARPAPAAGGPPAAATRGVGTDFAPPLHSSLMRSTCVIITRRESGKILM